MPLGNSSRIPKILDLENKYAKEDGVTPLMQVGMLRSIFPSLPATLQHCDVQVIINIHFSVF